MDKPSNTYRPSAASLALVVVSCAAAIAACGSSKPSSTARSSSYSRAVSYSDCMRSHGVPNFPDPLAGGGYPASISGVDYQAPAVQSAQSACFHLSPAANHRGPAMTEAQHKGMVLNARCIREHGVPNFPDPTIAPTHPIPGQTDPFVPGDINTRATAVEHAAEACARVGTEIPGVGSG